MRAMPALVVICSSLLAAPAYADDAVDQTRKIIEQQIDAFLNDDVDAAYSFAAPGIKARYPDKNAFFAMVKKSYQPVYHPGNFAFGRNKNIGEGEMILHEVIISADDGKDWKAVYQMLRQPDGSYRIGGVMIVPEQDSKGI